MSRGFGERGSVGALDAGDLAEQFAAVFIHDHYASLPGDEQTVIGWVGNDVVPAPIPAQRVVVGHAVRRG